MAAEGGKQQKIYLLADSNEDLERSLQVALRNLRDRNTSTQVGLLGALHVPLTALSQLIGAHDTDISFEA